jgi:hypothetical protein
VAERERGADSLASATVLVKIINNEISVKMILSDFMASLL